MGNRRRLPSVHNITGSKSSITLFWSSNSSNVVLSTAVSRQSESADLGECMIANTLAESESVPVRRPVFANAFLHMAVKRPSRQRAWVGSWPAAMEAVGMSRHAKVQTPKPKRPTTRLGLPDLDHSKSAVLDSLRPPESKRGYRKRDRAILAVLLGRGSDFDVANWLIWTSGICNSARSIGR